MMKMLETLNEGLPLLGLALPENRKQILCDFGEGVVRQNEVMNLTAITEPDRVARLHLLDSLTLLTLADLRGKKLIDVGCGAGFPGVPVKIACPEVKLTLLDSLGKRMTWLEGFLPQLGVEAQVVAARAEEYAAGHREQYDVVTSRAVARLNILCELCLPYVKVGGAFLALKGAMTEEEVVEAKKAISLLGGQVKEIREFAVADAMHRVVVIEKIKTTPLRYPRKFAKIKQSPL